MLGPVLFSQNDIPSIQAQRRKLKNLTIDMETAKNRWVEGE